MIWLTALGWARKAATALLGFIRAYPLQCALIASLCLSGWLWRGREHALDRVAAMEAASKQAGIDQAKVNHAPAVISQDIARKSDADAQDYYAKGRAAGLAYANAHRVPRPCPTSPADLPGADHAAPVDDGPGDAAVMVAKADFDLLTANNLRLAKVQQDALTLIAAGVAKGE